MAGVNQLIGIALGGNLRTSGHERGDLTGLKHSEMREYSDNPPFSALGWRINGGMKE